VLTSPQRLLAAVSARLQQLQAQAKGTEQQEQELQETLPSGESAVQAMQELQEDIQEYDQHVYSRLSRRDLQGL
jgi:phage gp29-like protein